MAPEADKAEVAPEQIVDGVAVAFTVGRDKTLSETVAEAAQPPSPVPVTVYTVLVVGKAVTTDPFVVSNPEDGFHTYVLAPVAESVALSPLQNEVEVADAFTIGIENSFREIVAEPVQPFVLVPITVYSIEAVGVETTDMPVVAFRKVAGDHA